MGTNIIDAFVVTWGMDTSNYKSGEKVVRQGNKRLRDESKRTFDVVEETGKRVGQSLRGIRNEIAGLLLVFTGGRSLLDFASNMLKSEAAAGRLGETIGVATSRVIAWQQAVKSVGGQGGEADTALQAIATAIQSYKLTGATGMDADLMGLGINRADIMNKDPSEILMKIAEAGERMSKTEFAARLQRIGLPQSVIYVLEKGRRGLEDQIAELEKHAHVTEADAKAAQKLQERLTELETVIMGKVRPSLTWLVDKVIELVEWLDRTGLSGPVAIGIIAGLGIAATGALGPWTLLAGAIAAVVAAMDQLIKRNPGVRDFLDWIEAPIKNALPKEWQWIFDRPGTPPGAPPASPSAPNPRGIAMPQGAQSNDAYIREQLARAGIRPEVVDGVVAGLWAESRLDPNAVNPTSGAYGISQWLGPRKKALVGKYGANPTLQQQVEFLISELKGGDRGGPKVLRQATADHALLMFISAFLRPAQGGETNGDIRRGRDYLFGKGKGTPTITQNIGTIVINSKATDPVGIARDIHSALMKRAVVVQSDAGVAP